MNGRGNDGWVREPVNGLVGPVIAVTVGIGSTLFGRPDTIIVLLAGVAISWCWWAQRLYVADECVVVSHLPFGGSQLTIEREQLVVTWGFSDLVLRRADGGSIGRWRRTVRYRTFTIAGTPAVVAALRADGIRVADRLAPRR